MKQLFSIIRHEWLRQRVNPATYLLFVIAAVIWYFFFFRQFFLIGQASLRPLFDLYPWFAIVFLPAVTMGSLAKEKTEQTLELLLTHPLREIEVIVAKFLSLLTIPVALSLTTLPLAIGVSIVGQLDWGIYLVQLLATWLFSGFLISFAMVFSAVLRDQVATLLSAIVSSFMWLLLGFELITSRLPIQLSNIVSNLAFLTHLNSLYRGVIDVRDIWFFISSIVVFLAVAVLYLQRQKHGARKSGYAMTQQVVVLLITVAVLSNIVGQKIPGRIDVTQSRLYSLTTSTKEVLKQVPDIVTLTLYASNSMPVQLQPILRDTKDILADYRQLGGARIQVLQKDPSLDVEVKQEAVELGVQEVQFNMISQEEFNVKSGYFGLVITYADQQQTIPFIQSTEDLEYQLTSLIYQMTRQDKPSVVFAAGHGEKNVQGELAAWGQLLQRQFSLSEVNLTVDEASVAEEIDASAKVLVVAAPTSNYEPALLESLRQFIENGGSLLVLASGVLADPETQTAFPVEHNLNTLLEAFGVKIAADFVYDLRSNETIRVSQGTMQYLLPYPLWVRARTTEVNPLITNPQAVMVTWGSSVTAQQETLKEKGWILDPLILTSQYGGVISNPQSLAPNQEFSETNLAAQTLGVVLTPPEGSESGKIVVIGSGDLLINELIQASPGNGSVGLAVVSWLAGDTILNTLRSKQAIDRSLVFSSQSQPLVLSVVVYGMAIGVPLIVSLVTFWRRRRQKKLQYQASTLFKL